MNRHAPTPTLSGVLYCGSPWGANYGIEGVISSIT